MKIEEDEREKREEKIKKKKIMRLQSVHIQHHNKGVVGGSRTHC